MVYLAGEGDDHTGSGIHDVAVVAVGGVQGEAVHLGGVEAAAP